MWDTRLTKFQRHRKRQADEQAFMPEASPSPLNAISDGEVQVVGGPSQEDRRPVPSQTLEDDGVEVTGEIIHQGQDEINTWPHHEVYYRRWIHKEITTLRQAVCQYGESTREGWEAIQKLMNTECRLEGQRKSWCINVLRYRWAVEACSLTSEVTNERMLLRRLLFKYGVETSDKHTLWGVFHQRLESRYPGSIPVPEGRNPGEFLEEVWKKVEQPKILQTRLFPWLEHEEQLFV